MVGARPPPPRPAGGEYGDIRARIDEAKLNTYLANNAPAVAVPVTIKQFKVRRLILQHSPAFNELSHSLARSELLTPYLSHGLNKLVGQSNPTYFLTDARSGPHDPPLVR
jgi:hypothetical protein